MALLSLLPYAPYACAGLALLAAALLCSNSILRKRLKAAQRASPADGALEKEFRLERFDVLWYPRVSYSPVSKTVAKARAGLPHCKSCVLPLSVSPSDGKWACSRCRTAYATTLADLAVVDSIEREALRYFLERNKDYQVTSAAGRA